MSPLPVPQALTVFIRLGNLSTLKQTPVEVSGYGDKQF